MVLPIHPWQTRYSRRGPDYRFNSNVTFGEIKRQFGFASIRLGRWVNAKEQQLGANLIFDALADLAFILNVPPQTIGLRNQLHLAFGSDGAPDAKAHYQPSRKTLALAKNAGGGALAHEFWHAFDHYIRPHLYPNSSQTLATQAWQESNEAPSHPLNQKLLALLNDALLNDSREGPSSLLADAMQLDRQAGSFYFSQPTEVLARAFEAYIQDSPIIYNNFLVSGSKRSQLAQAGAYPQGKLRALLNHRFTDYFSLLGTALINQSHTSKGIDL
ncbi:CLCA_X family protein [Celerinatantimonas sp. YJH-8]|uniref:CLCA_X family protein n=1 Tax=Celerinatantimonas sp. YJH-8 TaxID=3228714 RepID=UPI0038C5E126